MTESEFFKANEGLVYFTMKKFFGESECPDLLQEGRIGLLRAIRNYDFKKGKFSTFAVHYIRGHCQNYLADWSRFIRLPRHRQYGTTNTAKEDTVRVIFNDFLLPHLPETPKYSEDCADFLLDLKTLMKPGEYIMFQELFIKGRDQTDVGKDYGISGTYMSNIKTILKMRLDTILKRKVPWKTTNVLNRKRSLFEAYKFLDRMERAYKKKAPSK